MYIHTNLKRNQLDFCSQLTVCPPGEGIDPENDYQCGPCPDGQGILPNEQCGICLTGEGILQNGLCGVCLDGEGIIPMYFNQCGPCPNGQMPDLITYICTEP